jgi:hypothetical protein
MKRVGNGVRFRNVSCGSQEILKSGWKVAYAGLISYVSDMYVENGCGRNNVQANVAAKR